MRFDIITIFPEIFKSYFNQSIIKRAQKKKLIKIRIHNLRDFASDRHKKARPTERYQPFGRVDDRPYGGGPGMVIKIEPMAKAIASILKLKNKKSKLKSKVKIILFSASGKQFDQKMAKDLAKKYNHIIMIAGHYEGVDERIFKILSAIGYPLSAVSIGSYVLTGGELPAMVLLDAVSRHISGVLGKEESLEERRYGVGVPVFTRPEVFKWPIRQAQGKQKIYRVPKVLLSGDHKKIEEWRKKTKKSIF